VCVCVCVWTSKPFGSACPGFGAPKGETVSVRLLDEPVITLKEEAL